MLKQFKREKPSRTHPHYSVSPTNKCSYNYIFLAMFSPSGLYTSSAPYVNLLDSSKFSSPFARKYHWRPECGNFVVTKDNHSKPYSYHTIVFKYKTLQRSSLTLEYSRVQEVEEGTEILAVQRPLYSISEFLSWQEHENIRSIILLLISCCICNNYVFDAFFNLNVRLDCFPRSPAFWRERRCDKRSSYVGLQQTESSDWKMSDI